MIFNLGFDRNHKSQIPNHKSLPNPQSTFPLMPYSHVHNRPISIALVQMTCSESKEKNVEKALAKIAEAAGQGANIVCLQELFTGPYFCQTEDHRWFGEAEPIPGPTSEALAAAAKKHGVVVIGSLFERRTAGIYHNTAVILDADGSQV